MSVNVSTVGHVSVCAYSGCWTGHADVFKVDEFIIFTGLDLSFSTLNERESIAITMDTSDNVAILKLGSFAQPLLCTTTPIENDTHINLN